MEYTEKDLQKFWKKVKKNPGQDACWLWTAGAWSSGEPAVSIGGRIVSARRLAYQLQHGTPYPGKALRTYPPCFSKRCLRHLAPRSTKDDPQLSPATIARFWGFVDRATTPDACWLWTGPFNHAGYPYFEAEHRRWVVSQLIWILQYGFIPHGLHPIHSQGCEKIACVRHLELSTKKFVHLRFNRTHAKLTPEDVVAMRADYKLPAYTLDQLAIHYRLQSAKHVEVLTGADPSPLATLLTPTLLVSLRKDHAKRAYTLRMLAEKYGIVSLGQVCDIVHYHSWERVP